MSPCSGHCCNATCSHPAFRNYTPPPDFHLNFEYKPGFFHPHPPSMQQSPDMVLPSFSIDAFTEDPPFPPLIHSEPCSTSILLLSTNRGSLRGGGRGNVRMWVGKKSKNGRAVTVANSMAMKLSSRGNGKFGPEVKMKLQ